PSSEEGNKKNPPYFGLKPAQCSYSGGARLRTVEAEGARVTELFANILLRFRDGGIERFIFHPECRPDDLLRLDIVIPQAHKLAPIQNRVIWKLTPEPRGFLELGVAFVDQAADVVPQ